MRMGIAVALAMASPMTTVSAAAQTAPAQAPAPDTAAIIDAVRAAIRANYVLPAKRAAIDAALAKGLADGRYAGIDSQELSRRVTDDLFAVANDKHLGLSFNPQMSAQLGSQGDDDDAEPSAFFRDMARRRNHGVTELKVLDGNIRLMTYDGFIWSGPDSAKAIDGAMAFLKGGDAAIIDLRRNGGGSPDAVRHLASWFVPGNTKLVTFHLRSDPPTTSVTPATAPGTLGGIPVYVLTSGRSASAAEEFASHVAGFGFGTLVGATTAGAAYRNAQYPIPGGYVLSVSIGRPELPKGGDWEAKGVAPGIAVEPDKALVRAQQAALVTLTAKATGPVKTELEWLAALNGALATPVTPARALASYAGKYGERVVAEEGGRLTYQRVGGPKTAMVPLSADLFALEQDPRTRVRFLPTGAMAIERVDGSRSESPRG